MNRRTFIGLGIGGAATLGLMLLERQRNFDILNQGLFSTPKQDAYPIHFRFAAERLQTAYPFKAMPAKR